MLLFGLQPMFFLKKTTLKITERGHQGGERGLLKYKITWFGIWLLSLGLYLMKKITDAAKINAICNCIDGGHLKLNLKVISYINWDNFLQLHLLFIVGDARRIIALVLLFIFIIFLFKKFYGLKLNKGLMRVIFAHWPH